ncbi:hypothetical protein BC830DRAFT_1172680 [Chytriomyces sp. MP71]|nr:hypothetical protein BC830DRAFT_1172680 [Chytriomyces sp. MP71]
MSPASKIPKIIHRMYKNDSIPDKWKGCQQSCIDQHPGWQHNLWTDDSMLQFMRAFYPADVDNYLRYPYDIQRADAFRYFVLDFFGGVYIDMDIECKKPLDPLLNHTLYLPRTEPFGFSNDFLMAQPHHPLLQQLQRSLPHWNLYFGFPFLTVFLSTGPLFLGFQYTLNPGLQKMVSVMPLELYNGRDPKKSYLDHWDGNSWHKWDAVYIAWAWDAVRIGTRDHPSKKPHSPSYNALKKMSAKVSLGDTTTNYDATTLLMQYLQLPQLPQQPLPDTQSPFSPLLTSKVSTFSDTDLAAGTKPMSELKIDDIFACLFPDVLLPDHFEFASMAVTDTIMNSPRMCSPSPATPPAGISTASSLCSISIPSRKTMRECIFCPKTFPTKARLESHLLTHTGERPFKCTLCQKSYTTNNRLKVHIRDHTGERPYKCDHPGCGFSAKQACSLKSHKFTHAASGQKVNATLARKVKSR